MQVSAFETVYPNQIENATVVLCKTVIPMTAFNPQTQLKTSNIGQNYRAL
jgi:hypothetical protein